MNDLLCEKHQVKKECLGGRSAHISNRYCPACEKESALRHLLNKVNKVTAYHRHGNPIPAKALDELANAQLEYESA